VYEALLAEVIAALRGAGAEQLIFLEPSIPAGNRDNGLVFPDPERMGVDPSNLVGATHNYAESIDTTGLSLEATNTLIWTLAENQGTGVWIGEYGFWSTSPETLAVAARYAADEDARVQGGAWWQWRQPCGDPHSLHLEDGAWVPGETVVHLNTLDCTTGEDLGPTEPFLALLGRGYPRAAPGRILLLESDPASGRLRLEAEAVEAGGTVVLWTPTRAAEHEVWGEGITGIEEQPRGAGRLVTATVTAPGAWSMGVEPLGEVRGRGSVIDESGANRDRN
jgi:endoglycosylceramidase